MQDHLDKKVISATKWSTVTEVMAKIISPVTSMILARLLTPEAFGIVATLNIIISFAEVFTDAGFQKYIIQHEFKNSEDRVLSTNVAFWSNLVLSIVIWLLIFFFKDSLASLVGSPGMGKVLVVSCISIPLAAFSSIQFANFKRDFDFKTLFRIRLVSLLVPIIITVPLALWLRSYWALVIGTITVNLLNACFLTVYSNWKPKLEYSWTKFKEMFSFTYWSLMESIALWATGYVDVFIVGRVLDQFTLGLYTTSISTVGQIMTLITSATTPILFSSLSRLQDNKEAFRQMFLSFQRAVGVLVIPAGVGIYCFSKLIVSILLGNQWVEATGFVGLWGLTSALTIVFAHYGGEIYRSLGKPRISVVVQLLHLIVLVPAVIISVKYGFRVLYITRSLIRIESILINMIFIHYLVKLTPKILISNVSVPIVASTVMAVLAFVLLRVSDSMVWQVLSLLICGGVYCFFIYLNPEYRMLLTNLIKKMVSRS